MLEHVWRATQRAGCFERVLVASDDDEVLVVADAFGAEGVRSGPASSGTARCARVAPVSQAVMCVQADQPFVDPAHLRALSSLVGASVADVATLCTPLVGDPHDRARVKVAVNGPLASDFSRLPIPVGGPYRVHLGLYAFAPGALERCVAHPPSARSEGEQLEQLAWLDAGETIAIAEMQRSEPAIDTPGQLEAARARMT